MKSFIEYILENKGHQFEYDFKDALEAAAKELSISQTNYKIKNYDNIKYIDDAIQFLQKLKEAGVTKITSINLDGGKNNKREIFKELSNKEWKFVSPTANVGKILSDITLITNKGEIYLSLKTGSTLAFNNTGIGKFKPEQVKNGKGSIGWFLKKCINDGVKVNGTSFEDAYVKYFAKYRNNLLNKFITAFNNYKNNNTILQDVNDIINNNKSDKELNAAFSDFISKLISQHANEKGYSIVDIFAYYVGKATDSKLLQAYYNYIKSDKPSDKPRNKPHGYMTAAVKELFGKPSKNNRLVDILTNPPTNKITADEFNIKTKNSEIDNSNVDQEKISSIVLQATDFNMPFFKDCIKSLIGFGYIYVHLANKDIHFIDLRNETTLDVIAHDIEKNGNISVHAPDAAKRIDLKITSKYIDNLSLTFRNVNSGIFPNKMLLQYSGFSDLALSELHL